MTIQQLQQYPLSCNKKNGLAIKSKFRNQIRYVKSYSEDGVTCINEFKNFHYLYSFTPILYPLSCLTQEIEVYGERFVPIERIKEQVVLFGENLPDYTIEHDLTIFPISCSPRGIYINECLQIIQLLQSWFINYQGIEAVSPFDLDENPYK